MSILSIIIVVVPTLLFAYIGAIYYGVPGVIIGSLTGAFVGAIIAAVLANR